MKATTYKKVAANITTVGELKGVLTQFSNKANIYFTGCTNFSVAVSESGDILFDSNEYIDSLVSEND